MVPADSRRITRVPRYSGYRYAASGFMYGTVTLYGSTFQKDSIHLMQCNAAVLLPRTCVATGTVWAAPRSLATTGGIIKLFSFPAGTKMFQFPALAPTLSVSDRPSDGRVVPFGNLRIKGHLHLPEAYRSLSRPSSPL